MASIRAIVFLTVTVCLLVVTVKGAQRCGSNEEFEQYYNAGCEPSCEVPDKTGLLCSSAPSSGCACKSGFYRNNLRQCVTLGNC